MLPGGVRPPPPTRSATEQSSKPPTPPLPRPVRVYLLAYNVGAMYLWTVIGATVYQTTTEIQVEIPALGKLLDSIRHPWAYSPYNHSVYGAVGGLLCVTQTLALVELLHSVLGWVRSPPTAVATQLLARLWCVWAVSEHSRIAAESSWYAVMVLSWSISELVRYPLYALGLVGSSSSVLVWARYVTSLLSVLAYGKNVKLMPRWRWDVPGTRSS